MILLTFLFFLIALCYSMAGLGGGSSYIALLLFWNLPFHVIAPLALTCNIIVVTSGEYSFLKNGHFSLKLFLPFILLSVPFAYLGSQISVQKETLLILLSVSLLVAGGRLFFSEIPR